jgi:haloacetate dehalogenase
LLDIMPLEWVYSQGESGYARRYWHWYFQLQRGVAEALIQADPRAYASWFFSRSAGRLDRADVEHYLTSFARPATIAATLADYRTAFDVDRPRWEAETRAGRRIAVPLCILWGALGNLADAPVLDVWRSVASNVQGRAIAGSGHYIPEEHPEATAEAIKAFAQEVGAG